MTKVKKTDTLIVKGGGGAVWEVDDTDAIRGQIDDGSLKLIRGAKAAPKPAAKPQAPTEGDLAGAGKAAGEGEQTTPEGEQTAPEGDSAGA
jgi:hypothetical protein